jgi:U3 small nucleolar RNA-associated protein 10
MAGLARLAPDSVLHNIMPIFTFMGTNVFHRDDSYSFKVVQNVSIFVARGMYRLIYVHIQTIENIVPVMVSSLKSRHPPGLELYIGAREFLRIFTDASNHIPRHRRQKYVRQEFDAHDLVLMNELAFSYTSPMCLGLKNFWPQFACPWWTRWLIG